MTEKDSNSDNDNIEELPKSLQGIEILLSFLNKLDRKTASIREISKNTGLSMRVVKNILLQLEKFGQIERVLEKNNLLPKWRITNFGKKVIKEAEGFKKKIEFSSKEEELIYDISISDNIEKLKEGSKAKQEDCVSKLNDVQIELSKMLGSVLNINNPVFEDLMSFMLKRVKYLKQKLIILPSNPIKAYQLGKKGEKQKKITKEEEKLLLVEIYFLNSLISNEIKNINYFNDKLSKSLENNASSLALSVAKDLREEIRFLTSLISNRESLNINSHVISIENLKLLSKNKISAGILDCIIDISLTEEEKFIGVENIILNLLGKINRGEKQFNNHSTELSDHMPLYALYQLILDENPELNITIEQLEKVINLLADKAYIPGIKIIEVDKDHYLKVVQFKTHDISEDEHKIITYAMSLEKFTLGEIVKYTGWASEKVIDILNKLTDLGILKYSKSFLYGEQWYIVSENNK